MKSMTWMAALAAVAALNAPARAELKNWDRTFEVGPMPVIRVQVEDAKVRIHPGPAGRVTAQVHYESRHWGFVSGTKKPDVTLEQVGGEVRVIVREASWIVAIGAVREDLRVDVTVPDSCDLRVRSSDGSVEIAGPLAGRFDVGTSDGRQTLRDCRGDFRLSSEDGAILVTDADGVMQVNSSDGRVDLDGRFDVVSAKSRDGRMKVTARPGSRLAGPWSLETHDNALQLSIPKDLRADLEATTRDGGIRFLLPVSAPGSVRDGEVYGRLNGGGPVLRVKSQDGTITLATSD